MWREGEYSLLDGLFLFWLVVIGWEEIMVIEGFGYSLLVFLFLNGGCFFFSFLCFKLSSVYNICFYN